MCAGVAVSSSVCGCDFKYICVGGVEFNNVCRCGCEAVSGLLGWREVFSDRILFSALFGGCGSFEGVIVDCWSPMEVAGTLSCMLVQSPVLRPLKCSYTSGWQNRNYYYYYYYYYMHQICINPK